ncbi:fatty acid cis/trans isomerase [Methylomicrobium sp. RS1]|uniref:fatty acid cis/trans isomerase n=1 Tax=Candidatus Methylomicrobium oryzae TaxID=2802053 RepID=UPI001924453C|nr:fatty acid cis/trans isomerase [Methylomicrobium sp. RS1]MBL1265216.1 fatty acid cis/trans isomerase [Methylomicrobium sp. RS1]
MKRPLILLCFMVFTGCASLVYQAENYPALYGPSEPKQRRLTQEQAMLDRQRNRVSFSRDVKPILDSRCVVCHGCYDAPCQLKLGSIEGIDRGATKRKVYDFARFKAAEPTRLFIDAQDTAGWRQKEFYPILNERRDGKEANLDNSVLAKLIRLKREHPLPTSGKLDQDYDLEFSRDLLCPTVEEFPKYQRQHPQWGMPYAMPGLSPKEEATLLQWLQEGAKAEPLPPLSSESGPTIAKWETYLNGPTFKHKLVSRYLYEHLFIGHLHFQGHPEHEFYRLVRSKTAPGIPIEEIQSVRPYDDPGTVNFYYRLRPQTETIVDKIHFVYELSDRKMQRYDELFFRPNYQVTSLPSYRPEVAANPFKTFIELPLASKYRFLLDDAEYFVSGFIKGPVCRGEIATESIRDQFWVVFSQPGRFYPEKVAKALADNNQILALPGEEGDQIGLMGWTKFDVFGRQYLKKKDRFIDLLLAKDQGFGLENIWDGDGMNRNAALTIFRHFDSATVTQGLIGDTPLTAWVIDYPIFERLHYLLVAGFNVYGTAGHQVASRTYMDLLRQDGEDNFLRFMPGKQRQAIYNSWYQGFKGLRTAEALFSIGHETRINYRGTDYKQEFFDQVRQRLGKAAGFVDSINQCRQEPCDRAGATPLQQEVDRKLRKLTKLQGLELGALPEMSLLRVKTGDPEGDLVYTLLIDKAYSNISKMVSLGSRRLPKNDRITIIPGFVGSYPNFFFSVEKNRLGEFIEQIRTAKTDSNLEQFYSRFGIRRTNPEIWHYSDWFNEQHKKYRGLQAGLLDLSRYENL